MKKCLPPSLDGDARQVGAFLSATRTIPRPPSYFLVTPEATVRHVTQAETAPPGRMVPTAGARRDRAERVPAA